MLISVQIRIATENCDKSVNKPHSDILTYIVLTNSPYVKHLQVTAIGDYSKTVYKFCCGFSPSCIFIPFVFSDPLSTKHGPPLWKLGQGQACNHLQYIPLRAEGFPQLLLQRNPQRVEKIHRFFLQNCPPWVFAECHYYYIKRSLVFGHKNHAETIKVQLNCRSSLQHIFSLSVKGFCFHETVSSEITIWSVSCWYRSNILLLY